MRIYNSVDPLADIKYWWRYEAWPIHKFGIGVATGFVLWLAQHIITLEPPWEPADTPPSLLYSKDDYVDLTPDEIASLSPEQIPAPIPVNPRYADYIEHNNTKPKYQKLKAGAQKRQHKPKKTAKRARKISSAKHSAER